MKSFLLRIPVELSNLAGAEPRQRCELDLLEPGRQVPRLRVQ